MSTIKGHSYKEGSIHVKDERKKIVPEKVLFSHVEKVEWVEPLAFYHNSRESYAGERFFWKDRDGELTLAGAGNIHVIRSEEKDEKRYDDVENKWENITDHASVYNPLHAYGTGPLLFGGFSFDPVKTQEEEWSQFTPAFFYVPEIMLTLYGGEMYITTNIMCPPEEVDAAFARVNKKKQHLLKAPEGLPFSEAAKLIEINEQGPERWKQAINEVVSHIQTDDTLKKVVLARKITAEFEKELLPEYVLGNLLEQQPDSFIFSFESKDSCFLGASPERLVRKRDQIVLSTCLAGSIKRGHSPMEDDMFGEELLKDNKNRLEHDYVVQMIRDEMSGLCEEVNVPDVPVLMKIRDIQHLYTPVVGHTDPTLSILKFVEKLHPTPALGGLPTERALEEIRHYEQMDRGFYAAPIGWMDYRKNGEFAVALRSGLIQKRQAMLYAGCGIVEDSDADSEFNETRIKFRPMLRAIGGTASE